MAVHRLFIVDNPPKPTALWETDTDQTVYIGRGEMCAILVPMSFQKVSRQHARLIIENSHCYLEDVSTNGTLINNQPLAKNQRVRLRNDDFINLAEDFFLQYKVEDSETATAPTVTARATRHLLDASLFQKQIEQIFKACRNSQNVLLLGMPHMGKTTLLLALQRKFIQDHYFPEAATSLLVYCDMYPLGDYASKISPQAFFTLIADYLISEFERHHSDQTMLARLKAVRERLAAQPDHLLITDFRQILELIHTASGLQRVILLLDHFDEACRQLDPSLWGRLALLKRHLDKIQLSYVVAMRRPITSLQPGSSQHLNFETSLQRVVLQLPDLEAGFYWSSRLDFIFDPTLTNSIVLSLYYWAHGHPKLIEMAIAFLRHELTTITQPFPITKNGLPANLVEQLTNSEYVRLTCKEIWEALLPEEQTALLAISKNKPISDKMRRTLLELQLLVKDNQKLSLFAEPFTAFVKKQAEPAVKEEKLTAPVTPQAVPRRVITDKFKLLGAETDHHSIQIMPERYQIIIDGKTLDVGEKGGVMMREFEVLVLLYNHKGSTVPDARVGDEFFKPDIDWEAETLHRSMNRLSDKLCRLSGIDYRFIHRVRTIGYRLVKAK
jgi:hypothetical protein